MIHRLRRLFAIALALAFSAAAPIASGSFHTFQIEQIFSNADGTVQFVVLHEAAGLNGQNFLAGHTFTSTQGGAMQTYTFMTNLPGGMGGYGGMPSPTAHAHVLIATQGFAQLGLVTPDYVIPNGFLPLTNGALSYAGVDFVNYTALPTDGTSALDRFSNMPVQNVAINFAGEAGSVTGSPSQTATAVEYYYSAWNFYFMTSFTAEIQALDGGAFGGAWKRTGQTFSVWAQPTGGASPTCRFFSIAFAPRSSHLYTPYPAECQFVKTNPADVAAWEFENIAFYIQLTDANGMCGAGTIPLYRVFNNGMGGAPNHRYTTNRAIRDQMLTLGWSAEGNGPDIIFACVPM